MPKDPSPMEGRKYNHAARLHKIAYVAMMRLAWKGFLLCIHANDREEVRHLEEAHKSISTFHDEVSTSFTAQRSWMIHHALAC